MEFRLLWAPLAQVLQAPQGLNPALCTVPCTITMVIILQHLIWIPVAEVAVHTLSDGGGVIVMVIPASTVINHRLIYLLCTLEMLALSLCSVSACD